MKKLIKLIDLEKSYKKSKEALEKEYSDTKEKLEKEYQDKVLSINNKIQNKESIIKEKLKDSIDNIDIKNNKEKEIEYTLDVEKVKNIIRQFLNN